MCADQHANLSQLPKKCVEGRPVQLRLCRIDPNENGIASEGLRANGSLAGRVISERSHFQAVGSHLLREQPIFVLSERVTTRAADSVEQNSDGGLLCRH